MNSEDIRSPRHLPERPLPGHTDWPLPADDQERCCKPADDQAADDELPFFPVEPPVSWPRVFPGL